MDLEMRGMFDKIERSIASGNGRLEAKLDTANSQFNDHLTKDAVAFTELKIGQASIETKIEAQERRRKDESDKTLAKITEQKSKNFQMRIAWLGGILAIVAAVFATLIGSWLTYIEAKADRAERVQQRQEDKLKASHP